MLLLKAWIKRMEHSCQVCRTIFLSYLQQFFQRACRSAHIRLQLTSATLDGRLSHHAYFSSSLWILLKSSSAKSLRSFCVRHLSKALPLESRKICRSCNPFKLMLPSKGIACSATGTIIPFSSNFGNSSLLIKLLAKNCG